VKGDHYLLTALGVIWFLWLMLGTAEDKAKNQNATEKKKEKNLLDSRAQGNDVLDLHLMLYWMTMKS
jgi:hypothetical protein